LENERDVSYEEGIGLANELGIDFIEVSAKENTQIDNIFYTLTKKYFFDFQNLKNEKKKKKKGLFSSLSNDDDVEIKFSKN
jgi:translation initiation factor IF-3